MELGAFYPFSRNHNAEGQPSQEPYLYELVASASRSALAVRYSLMPYWYTLFFFAHSQGASVWRPVFFEFPGDRTTWSIETQFMIGPALLVTPALYPSVTTTVGYFPEARWFDLATLSELAVDASDRKVTLDAPIGKVPVHIRGGHILALQSPGMTTLETSQGNFTLVVALDADYNASGYLYLDDGDTMHIGLESSLVSFNFSQSHSGQECVLSTQSLIANYRLSPGIVISNVRIAGFRAKPIAAWRILDSERQPLAFEYDDSHRVCSLTDLGLDPLVDNRVVLAMTQSL